MQMVDYERMLWEQILAGLREKLGSKKTKIRIRSGWYDIVVPFTVYFMGEERRVVDSVEIRKGVIVDSRNFKEHKEVLE